MEKLMQYVWQHRLWPVADLCTVDGERVEIIDPGLLNTGSGPDFFNAKVDIGGRMWAGNVEIHVRASDWRRHGHDSDPAYDSVILHVVDRDDAIVRRADGSIIPQMRMPCDPGLNNSYGALVERADTDLPCAREIAALAPVYLSDWLSALAFERLYDKAARIDAIRERLGGDWEQTCYVTVARGLGFGTNGEPFERMALSLPLIFLGKHSDSLTSLEALLFGQSGLLTEKAAATDPYAAHLLREYRFLATKFGLRPPQNLGWKTGRMRPANFPHRRIAVLAAMLHGGFRLMARILDAEDAESAVRLFSPEMSPYWARHYSFGPAAPHESGALSRASAAVLAVNVVAPLMMAFGQSHGDEAMMARAVDLLHDIRPESNTIVELFGRAGIKARDAFTSQALIKLRRAYCEQRKCLYCRIGHRMLSYAARRT